MYEVDLALGTVKPLHIHAAHDVGRAINPTLTEGQIHGGIAQGIGLALMEEYINGRTDNLHDYLIPSICRFFSQQVLQQWSSHSIRRRRSRRIDRFISNRSSQTNPVSMAVVPS